MLGFVDFFHQDLPPKKVCVWLRNIWKCLTFVQLERELDIFTQNTFNFNHFNDSQTFHFGSRDQNINLNKYQANHFHFYCFSLLYINHFKTDTKCLKAGILPKGVEQPMGTHLFGPHFLNVWQKLLKMSQNNFFSSSNWNWNYTN